MTLTAGTISLVSKTASGANLSSTAASGGTGPYTQQWYRSTTTGFTPGAGNLIAGATGLTLNDSGLAIATTYYYKVVYTDTGASNAMIIATQLAVTTTADLPNPNQFALVPVLGMIDLRFDFNTVAVIIDAAQSGSIVAGQAVKIVDSAGGVPKVVACTADADEVLGFVNFNFQKTVYLALDPCEISMAGNVMYLLATAAIARGAQCALDSATVGGVKPISGAGGEDIVGWAYDKATAAGQLIRVFVKTPSFLKDGT